MFHFKTKYLSTLYVRIRNITTIIINYAVLCKFVSPGEIDRFYLCLNSLMYARIREIKFYRRNHEIRNGMN